MWHKGNQGSPLSTPPLNDFENIQYKIFLCEKFCMIYKIFKLI